MNESDVLVLLADDLDPKETVYSRARFSVGRSRELNIWDEGEIIAVYADGAWRAAYYVEAHEGSSDD